MQVPNADTQWNDILRSKGIIPPKEDVEITEDEIQRILDETIEAKTQKNGFENMGLKELDEIEDDITEEDEKAFEAYRRQRLQELMTEQKKACYGEVGEISRTDFVREVNQAGEGIWVVVHVYKQGIPLCTLVNQHLSALARKFPATKFLKSIASVCIPGYPDKNLPTIFVYNNGDLKRQFIGPLAVGTMKLTQNELEWMLSETGAIATDLEENPRRPVHDVMSTATTAYDSDDD